MSAVNANYYASLSEGKSNYMVFTISVLGTCGAFAIARYHCGKTSMPVIGDQNPSKNVIISEILNGQVNRYVCTDQPKRVRQKSLFLLDQKFCKIKIS